MQRPMLRLIALVVSILLVNSLCLAPSSRAATIDWINPAGGVFQIGSNWTGGVPPGTGDQARFALVNTPLNVTLTANVFNQRLIIASGADVTFHNSGINYVANDAAVNGITIGDVAGDAPARFNLASGGRIGAFDIALGESVGAAGIGTIGAGASWGSSRTFRIGQAGAGTLNATPGSFLTAVAGDTIVADAPTATGFLESDSMFLSVGALHVGRGGSGTWRITGDTSIGSGNTFVGELPGSHGLIDLVSNSEYTLGGSLYVGDGGAGALMFRDGTIAVSGSTFVARLAGSTGRIDISDGAFYAGNSLTVAGDTSAPGGAGTVAINGGSVAVAQTLRAWSGGRVEWNGGALSTGQVELKPGGRMTLAHGSEPKVLRVTRLEVDGPGAARLDLGDNAAVVNYPAVEASPFADLRQQVALGFAGGSWNGDGITSSFAAASPIVDALGIAEAADLGITGFLGQPVDATTIIVRYTLAGDADLDGSVTLLDFNRLAANFGLNGKFWSAGDFNYDGAVNLLDFNLLAQNFGLGAGADGIIDPQDWASLAAAVPEPVMSGLTIVATSCALANARRRKNCAGNRALAGIFR
jgi:hypothetical protein